MNAISDKLPFIANNSNLRLPQSLSLEQCSSQATAMFKAGLVDSGDAMADLTGGFGIDTLFLSPKFDKAWYIERSGDLCDIARHNFKELGRDNIEVINGDSIEFSDTLTHLSLIYADPARRSRSGGKLVSIADCEPNLLPVLDKLLSKCDTLMVKLSPMLDISVAIRELQHVSDIYVVSVNGECKELLAIVRSGCKGDDAKIHCVNLPVTDEFVFSAYEERNATAGMAMPLRYLYEPNSSILKAGAFKTLCEKFGVSKIAASSHLYTSESLVECFPGRKFEITDVRKVHKEFFGDIAKANLTVRNFPTSVAELRKKLKINDGGDVFLFATTLMDNTKRIIVCRRLPKGNTKLNS